MQRNVSLDAVNAADIRGAKVRLRPMQPDELRLVYDWEADPEVALYYGTRGRYSNFGEYAAAVDPHYLNGSRPEMGRCFIIEADSRPIGMVNYNQIDVHHRSTEIDIVIGHSAYRDGGYGSDALRAFLRFLFDDIGLHRVWLATLPFNDRARRVYEKLGFVQEGVFRESDMVDGRWVDSLIYGILEDEFRAMSDR